MPELPDRQITDIDKYKMLFFRLNLLVSFQKITYVDRHIFLYLY